MCKRKTDSSKEGNKKANMEKIQNTLTTQKMKL